ncbi:hypothetical protein ACG2F4_18475, partial [Halalkalibaculum sp. DA3122]|uniref:hypothetical protein n=1 Tax=Halalkalibaculum sp. DA3122 TaxID=3373607 RepID=UPI0037547F8E
HFLYGQKTNQKSRWGMVDVPLTSSFPAGCFQTPAASPLLPAAIPQTPGLLATIFSTIQY